MQHSEDIIRLHHMLDAAEQAIAFTKNKNRADLDTDQMLLFAVIHAIEILGEAAGKVSKEFRDQYPVLPWPSIIAMRNRLVHAYFDIDLDRVWSTVTDDIPPLISELRTLLKNV